MDVNKPAPITDGLVVNHHVRFWQERGETVFQPHFTRTFAGVSGPAGTPAEQLRAVPEQLADVSNDSRNRNAGATRVPYQCFIHIDVNDLFCHSDHFPERHALAAVLQF